MTNQAKVIHLTEEQQMIIEAYTFKVFSKITDGIDKRSKQLTSAVSDNTQKLYKNTGLTRDFSNLVIDYLDKIIMFFAQALTQSEKLGLNEKNTIAKDEMNTLITYRKELLKQRSIRSNSKVSLTYVLTIFLKLSFVYPFKMFNYSKTFYSDIDEDMVKKNKDCGASLAIGRMFEVKYALKILAIGILIIGILILLFKATATSIAVTQVASLNAGVVSSVNSAYSLSALLASGSSTAILSQIASFGFLVFKNIFLLLTTILKPLNAFSYLLLTRCEDTGKDSIRKHEIALNEIKRSMKNKESFFVIKQQVKKFSNVLNSNSSSDDKKEQAKQSLLNLSKMAKMNEEKVNKTKALLKTIDFSD